MVLESVAVATLVLPWLEPGQLELAPWLELVPPIEPVVGLDDAKESQESLKCDQDECDFTADCSLNLARHREGSLKYFKNSVDFLACDSN